MQILSYVAQTEREFTHQRQAEGIAAAQQRGVKFGRKPLDLPKTFYDAKDKYETGKISYRQAAELCGMKPLSFYRYCQSIQIILHKKADFWNQKMLKNVDVFEHLKMAFFYCFTYHYNIITLKCLRYELT